MALGEAEENPLDGVIEKGFSGKIVSCKAIVFEIGGGYTFSNRLIAEDIRKVGVKVIWTGKEFVPANHLQK
jgi:hypothetical protein